MATVATEPRADRLYRWWVALALVLALGIAAAGLAVVRTLPIGGEGAEWTAVVSPVQGATQTRALNQPGAAPQISGASSISLNAVLALRALNEMEAPTAPSIQHIMDGRHLNEPPKSVTVSLQAVRDLRSLNR
jgi:hypothetical protein